MDATLGQRIARARRAAGITQSKLAQTYGVQHSTVARWEGGRSFPGMERLEDMAVRFGVDRVWLVMGEGEGPALPSADSETDVPSSAA